ncbi:hypothetical protein FA13DRAFT_1736256 [Coprinellus micaceus]|uniref:Uncharacterized protein n=1 Tax=Coprinellus micaceus TaxID=71717 RepID=A0A4Y7T0W3_COPMI|nr:hypothetical protein FA13DRAFT_1736256 [Coprinellus micaceus]
MRTVWQPGNLGSTTYSAIGKPIGRQAAHWLTPVLSESNRLTMVTEPTNSRRFDIPCNYKRPYILIGILLPDNCH